ncbi:alpha/beta fold hydrolase [Psychrobacter sp. BF1]|uniref:alpha/beta fold hydrolase n=1 Tax=Psychrobacter sp. BF1 TaxID=2821147 RepID=UPI00211A1996|nr:alpha/beta hydrolase [Psychrobacter sp. BF1]
MSQLCINDPEQARAIYYSYSAETPSKLMENMPTILAKQYQLQTIHVLAVDGTPLPISVIGNGMPVLMLHAFGMDTRQFLPFILPLTNHYRFYLPHFRGFGLATALTLPNFDFIEQYAEDTEQVLKYITIENNAATVSVAGISMGALVMWAYFKRFGTNQFSRYLNIDQAPIIHNQPDFQGGVFGARQDELFAQFESLISNTKPYMQVEDFRHLPYEIKTGLLTMERAFSLLSVSRKSSELLIKTLSYRPPHKVALMTHSTWQHKLRCLSAYMQLPYDYREVLEMVNIPTTLLVGGRSKLYDSERQLELADRLPNAKVEILAKSGHAVPMDAPFGFYRALKGFLES